MLSYIKYVKDNIGHRALGGGPKSKRPLRAARGVVHIAVQRVLRRADAFRAWRLWGIVRQRTRQAVVVYRDERKAGHLRGSCRLHQLHVGLATYPDQGNNNELFSIRTEPL